MSVLFDCIGEKGIHLPVAGYIYFTEREGEREGGGVSEIEREI